LCGGSGLYIESAIKNYKMLEVPPNETLRDELKNKTLEELERVLKTYKKLHNKSDTDTPKRAIRAIEIAEYYAKFPPDNEDTDTINSIIFGIKYDREIRRQRITSRLHQRINEGMIEEGEQLHKMGLSYKDMEYYGLEYKYLSWFLQSKINKTEMVEKLNTAIHQFAKRQMTWFRKMERNGTPIHWINGELPIEDKLDIIENYIKKAPNK
jgi:tRNA dimethylallyltransferase